jgi:hypothetical protein
LPRVVASKQINPQNPATNKCTCPVEGCPAGYDCVTNSDGSSECIPFAADSPCWTFPDINKPQEKLCGTCQQGCGKASSDATCKVYGLVDSLGNAVSTCNTNAVGGGGRCGGTVVCCIVAAPNEVKSDSGGVCRVKPPPAPPGRRLAMFSPALQT